MTDSRIVAIQGTFGPEDCRAAIARAETPLVIRGYRRIFYPYDYYLLGYRASTWLGATGMTLSCLVDSRTGTCATADPFRTESVATGDALALARRIGLDSALSRARRYAARAIRQRHKALVFPRVEALESGSVYKPFWVVDCEQENAGSRMLLFDGITGECCSLPWNKFTTY